MTREKPIIMCPEMVIQEDRKSQTRQLVKLPPVPEVLHWQFDGWMDQGPDRAPREEAVFVLTNDKTHFDYHYVKPRYQVGDELWCKETWGVFDESADEDVAIGYKAGPDDEVIWFDNKAYLLKGDYRIGQWRSSRFMFKDFARLWLRITAVKDPEQREDGTWEFVYEIERIERLK